VQVEFTVCSSYYDKDRYYNYITIARTAISNDSEQISGYEKYAVDIKATKLLTLYQWIRRVQVLIVLLQPLLASTQRRSLLHEIYIYINVCVCARAH
jgi:hypothetical protein